MFISNFAIFHIEKFVYLRHVHTQTLPNTFSILVTRQNSIIKTNKPMIDVSCFPLVTELFLLIL